MSVSQATKLRWFDRGAAAFERTFPGLIASRVGADVGPVYVCPICDQGFKRGAVAARVLTAEDVPPKSFGGRPLLLTCQKCNNEAGAKLEAHARKKEDLADVIKGKPDKALKVRMRCRDLVLNAELAASGTAWNLNVPGRVNSPAAVAALQTGSAPATGDPITVEFVGNRFSEFGAKLSWLKSGFLTLFAAWGYRFSCDPALTIVKRQLRSPHSRLIHNFAIDIPRSLEWADLRIVEIPDPRCTGVVIGGHVALYPHAGDVSFYDRLEGELSSQTRKPSVTFTGPSFGLAEGDPRLGYDDWEPTESPPDQSCR